MAWLDGFVRSGFSGETKIVIEKTKIIIKLDLIWLDLQQETGFNKDISAQNTISTYAVPLAPLADTN